MVPLILKEALKLVLKVRSEHRLEAFQLWELFFDNEDTYVEVGYPLGGFDVAIGAGDAGYSVDGEFALVNVSLSSGKDIQDY